MKVVTLSNRVIGVVPGKLLLKLLMRDLRLMMSVIFCGPRFGNSGFPPDQNLYLEGQHGYCSNGG